MKLNRTFIYHASIIAMLNLSGCSDRKPAADASETAGTDSLQIQSDLSQEEKRRTHVNGQVHDPCSKCDKNLEQNTRPVHQYVYFQKNEEENIIMCLNNRPYSPITFPDIHAAVPKLIKIVVDTASVELPIAFDLCDKNFTRCGHPHPSMPTTITVATNSSAPKKSATIVDPYTQGVIYSGGQMKYGFVDEGDSSFMFVNNLNTAFTMGSTVTYRTASVRVPLGGNSHKFTLAYDIE